MPVITRVRAVARRLSRPEAPRTVEILLRYGAGGEAERVHLALLRPSGGDLARLEREVEAARADLREMLAPAGFPRQRRRGDPRRALARPRWWLTGWQDEREYAAWLRRLDTSDRYA